MSDQASQLVQAIYNLSAIANELDKIKSMLDPTSTEETKEQIAVILSKVKETNSTVLGISSDFAKGTKLTEYYNTTYGKLFQTYDECAQTLQNVNTILANYSTEANATANKEAVVSQINKAITLVEEVNNWLGEHAATKSDIPTDYATSSQASAIDQKLGEIQDSLPTHQISVPDTTTSQELTAGVVYVFAERTADLTLTLGAAATGTAAEYHLFVEASGTPTITWPDGISWNGGSAPTIASGKTYEVSILNNVAAFFEV